MRIKKRKSERGNNKEDNPIGNTTGEKYIIYGL